MLFVTGGTGLVGAHLLLELTQSGEKIRALKRKDSKLQQVIKIFSYYTNEYQKLFDTIEWIEGDMLDYYSLEKALSGVSAVYHCAAIVSFNKQDREALISDNVEGTRNMVNAAIENWVKRICHVSSIAALGSLTNGNSVTEQTPWVPSKNNSAYSESKFFSETEIWRGIEEGLEAVIVNPSIILGPANWHTGSAQFFKTIGAGMKFYTKGVTGYISVKDVVNTMILLMSDKHFPTCKNQRFLLNAENLSYQEVFFQIADALNKPRPSVFASDFMLGMAWRIAGLVSLFTRKAPLITREIATGRNAENRYDGSKITNKTGFCYTPISEIIKTTAAFYRNDQEKN